MIGSSIHRVLRTFSNQKHYSVLNIVGLSVGMVCSILLALYLEHELTYDRHNIDHQSIYRVIQEIDATNNTTLHAQTSHFLGPLLIRDYPQIEKFVSFRRANQSTSMLKYESDSYFVDELYIADNSVFEIFTHKIIHGEPNQALTRPNTLAINQTISSRLFGSDNPVGRIVTTGVLDYEVTLVFEDLPDNSHFKYSALIANQGNLAPTADALANQRGNLWNLNGFTYLLMNLPSGEPEGEVFDDFFARMMSDITRGGYRARFYLEPLASIHLNSVALQDLPRGNTYYLYAFSAVAILVLLIACFNYINLATARAIGRSREIFIRKILGADRRVLISQFLAESIFYSLLALFIAVLVIEIFLLGSIEVNLFGREFDSGFWRSPLSIAVLLTLGLSVGVIAGIYPAFYLASMGEGSGTKVAGKNVSSKVRGVLVFAQFTISIAVISATILMFLQLQYMDEQAIGFEKENKLLVRVQGADAIERVEGLIQQLRSNPVINNVSLAGGNPITGSYIAALEVRLDDGSQYNVEYSYTRVDRHYIDTLSLKLIDGRGFETGSEAELRQVVINQAMVDQIGWEDPVGRTFTIGGSPEYTVIGVLANFRYEDIHSQIKPFVFYYDDLDFVDWSQDRRVAAMRELIIDVDSTAVEQAIKVLQEEWENFVTAYPLQYEFLDEVMEQLRVSDSQQINLIAIFAVFCIFISCLGLFGLTAFTTQMKSKEIGIRKTLGAATYQIIMLLFNNILKLLLIASLFASLIAYMAINGWLESFYYREAINPIAFVVASLLSIGVALITLTLQSYKTAAQNPVVALRYE